MCIPNQLSPSVSKRELHLKISLQPQFHQLSVRVLNGQKQNTLPCQCNQKAAEGATVTRPFPGSPPPLSELLGSVIRQVAVLHAHYCRLHLLLTEEDAIAIGKRLHLATASNHSPSGLGLPIFLQQPVVVRVVSLVTCHRFTDQTIACCMSQFSSVSQTIV